MGYTIIRVLLDIKCKWSTINSKKPENPKTDESYIKENMGFTILNLSEWFSK